MSAATATLPSENTESSFSLSNIFSRAVSTVGDAAKGVGSLAYDFAKANPIVTAVGLDLALTGGTLTKQALVAGTKTIAGALGELGVSAGSSAWGALSGMVFGH